MNKNVYCVLVACLLQLAIFNPANSQNKAPSKPVISFEAIDQWIYVDRPAISPDGKYAGYILENSPKGYQTLVLHATGGSWKEQFVSKDFHYGDFHFSHDGRYCLFSIGDSLGIANLGTSGVNYIPHISRFEMIKGDSPDIIYETSDSTKQTVVYAPASGEKLLTIHCQSYTISPDGASLLYQSTASTGTHERSVKLTWYDLKNQSSQVIWEGREAMNFVFDAAGKKLAFLAKEDTGKALQLLYYQQGDPSAEVSVVRMDHLPGRSYGLSSITGFTRDGSMLYLKVKDQTPPETPSSQKAKVDIWNFNDPMLQEEELERHIQPDKEIFSVLHLDNDEIYPLCQSKGLYWDPADKDFPDKLFLYTNNAGGEINEFYWNRLAEDTVSLISAVNGEKKIIDFDLSWGMASSYHLSPSGKFILYYNAQSNNYFSYAVESGTRVNLTKNIPAEWYYTMFKVQKVQQPFLIGIMGWIRNTNDVLLESKSDIWRVSLDGKRRPVCITKGYGAAHHIEFRMPESFGGEKRVFNEGEIIYLSAFNPQNKQNGFFSVDLNGQSAPSELTMGNYAYFVPWTKGELAPIKAENADAWVVARQRSDASVNYFFTRDFKIFKPLSNNYPERNYNWVTSELINWKLPDGHISQGILYKPDNFDPRRKYPLIFLYYEELSNNLNVYQKPERSVCNVNIPYYVSNGYLVFTPDIERTSNGTGPDALHAMESAAKYLSRFPYVDGARLGLNGTSMGGYKTNYIVTHSHLFAAANPVSGPSSIASFGLCTWGDAMAIGEVEDGQFYIGHSIVERPDLYVTNSPIFYIKNVQTPLLMMYNKNDQYNYVDGVAMFQALRRSGKRAWMLQYDGQGHFLDDQDTTVTTDYTIRQKQFFDHYLMGKPAPVWMTKGVPAWKKGIEDGLEPDKKDKTPEAGLYMPDKSYPW